MCASKLAFTQSLYVAVFELISLNQAMEAFEKRFFDSNVGKKNRIKSCT